MVFTGPENEPRRLPMQWTKIELNQYDGPRGKIFQQILFGPRVS